MNFRLFLLSALFFTLFAGTSAAAFVHPFADISGHPAEEYIDKFIQDGILTTKNADGSLRRNFFPEKPITMAEFLKLVILSFSGEEGTALQSSSGADSSGCNDVPETPWYFEIFRRAENLGLISPNTRGNCFPEKTVTTADALKILFTAADIELVEAKMELPVSGISERQWFFPYVQTAYALCVERDESGKRFAPQKYVTRGEAILLLQKTRLAREKGTQCVTEEEDNVPEPDEEAQSEASDGEIPQADTISVRVSPENPGNRAVPQQATNVPFLVLEFTAPPEEGVEITHLIVTHKGLGNIEDIERVKVLVGLRSFGNSRSFSRDDRTASLRLETEPVMIPAGRKETVTLAADLDAAGPGGVHIFTVAAPEDITVIGSESGKTYDVVGNFPLQGGVSSPANASIGVLEVTVLSVSDQKRYIGEKKVELARMTLEETTGESDVSLLTMQFEISGAKDDDLANLYVESGTDRISEIVPRPQGRKILFDFRTTDSPQGWNVQNGDRKTLRVRGDIIGGVGNDLRLDFDELQSDVVTNGGL